MAKNSTFWPKHPHFGLFLDFQNLKVFESLRKIKNIKEQLEYIFLQDFMSVYTVAELKNGIILQAFIKLSSISLNTF